MAGKFAEGPTSRERWMLAECVKTAARVADAAFCSEDGVDREYGRGEMVLTAELLVRGDKSETVSRNQLENLSALIELALEMVEEK